MKRDVCPMCGNPTVADHSPVCSRGCKDRDLLKWLGEGYRLPGERTDPETQTGLDTSDPHD